MFQPSHPIRRAGLLASLSRVPGRWGEPHSYFTLTVDGGLPADTPDLALPEQLQAPKGTGSIDAPFYPGSHEALDIIIAPPSFTGGWGLVRPLEDFSGPCGHT